MELEVVEVAEEEELVAEDGIGPLGRGGGAPAGAPSEGGCGGY